MGQLFPDLGAVCPGSFVNQLRTAYIRDLNCNFAWRKAYYQTSSVRQERSQARHGSHVTHFEPVFGSYDPAVLAQEGC